MTDKIQEIAATLVTASPRSNTKSIDLKKDVDSIQKKIDEANSLLKTMGFSIRSFRVQITNEKAYFYLNLNKASNEKVISILKKTFNNMILTAPLTSKKVTLTNK